MPIAKPPQNITNFV